MEFNEKLQMKLRKLETPVSMYTIAQEFGIHVDTLLERILVFQKEHKEMYKNNVTKIAKGQEGFSEDFFKNPVIDLGMLIQCKIVEIAEALKNKPNSWGHRMWYDQWILYRGY